MKIDVNVKAITTIDIDSEEAFRILCKVLHMDFVLENNAEFFIKKNTYGENSVYHIVNGHDECFDDRGDLFVALRNVAVNIFPNLEFRSASYIYNN